MRNEIEVEDTRPILYCCFCGKNTKNRVTCHGRKPSSFTYLQEDETAHLECYIDLCFQKAMSKYLEGFIEKKRFWLAFRPIAIDLCRLDEIDPSEENIHNQTQEEWKKYVDGIWVFKEDGTLEFDEKKAEES